MAVKLSFDELKWFLKCYWKMENAGEFKDVGELNLVGLLHHQQDFNLLGTLKNMVYATKTRTLEELRDQIIHVINEIPLAAIQTVCRSVRRHCWECTVADCGHFQFLVY